MGEFQKEERYVVLKVKDIKAYLSFQEQERLSLLCDVVDVGRKIEGKPSLDAVVVEKDWPEYEAVWNMIESRVLGNGVWSSVDDRKRLKDLVWLSVAFDLSRLGTCSRRRVGVVFLDARGRVLATGYNGTAPGQKHCTDSPCPGASCASGTGLELCEAIHAEQNAGLQCKFPDEVDTVYCTDSPCMHCVKMLATTAAKRVVFAREYPHAEAKAYWESMGRKWDHVPVPVPSDVPSKTSTKLVGALFYWARVWVLGQALGLVLALSSGAFIIGRLKGWF